MSVPIIVLADALVGELGALLGKTFERKYAPYYEQVELLEAKYVVLMAGETTSSQRRGLSDKDLTIWCGMQQALPDREERDQPFVENRDWLDARLQDVQNIKNLFEPGGALRDKPLADCEFMRMAHDPLYRADLLIQEGIFTSVVELVYQLEI
jgi:hypothetical protein